MKKRIIICADGTWNKPEQIDRKNRRKHRDGEEWVRRPSNVVKVARAILPQTADGMHQVVFYDTGVGTGWGILDPIVGGAFGRGLSKNILDCYRFLVHNYNPDDEIFLFGFSRGAYTVRSLAGFIQKCGLLPKDGDYWIPRAYRRYRLKVFDDVKQIEAEIPAYLPAKLRQRILDQKITQNEKNKAAVKQFRKRHKVQDVKIEFIGVWDTVGALGIPFQGIFGGWLNRKYAFHNVKIGDHIEHAYQALAIDEQRVPFRPTLWRKKAFPAQTLKQVWFAGVHTNVGGGYRPDGLANCALQWMVDQAEQHNLEFDKKYLRHFEPHPESTLRNSMTWYYRLLGVYERPIGQTEDGYEAVHASAYIRRDLDPPPAMKDGGPYDPPNLPPRGATPPDVDGLV